MSDLVERLLGEEEGRERCAYQDSRGFLTIGIGCLVDKRVTGAGLCDAAIDAQFEWDIRGASSLAAKLPGWEHCNNVQQAVLTSMVFQLGDLHAWAAFRAALAMADFNAAANAGLDSAWARQTPARAQREMYMLRTGSWLDHGVEPSTA